MNTVCVLQMYCIHTFIHNYTYKYIRTFVRMYIHTCIHTYIHTYKNNRCPSTVLGIKDHLKAVWQQAMMIPLRALSANIADEGAWKLLFLLPSMLLARDAQRGGKKGSGEIKRKFKRFLAYQWAPLLVSKDGRRVNHSDSSPEAVRQGILKKVESCVREGDISRAARLLTSSGLAPDSAETLQRLKAKHPQSSVPLSSPCDDSAGPITLERESFLKALKSTPRGSAPGPSGLRFEHLKVCSEVRDLCDCFCGIVQKVAAGGLGPVVGRALASARLIALAKGGGDVRPIAVGEVLRRLVARSICIQERATMADIFSPVQYGVATPGGLDQVVHQIQAGLEAHSDWGVFKCDLRNAFNFVSRQAFFNETLQFLPSIMPFTWLLYGQPSPLIYRGSQSTTVLMSSEGVHQGDPLGPFYFCIAINAVLQRFQESHGNLSVSASWSP